MSLIRRTKYSPRAKSWQVADKLISDAAKSPSSLETAGKRETPAMETGRRLAQVTGVRRIWYGPMPLSTPRAASLATDDEAHCQIQIYDAASSADGLEKNGRTGETGNWRPGAQSSGPLADTGKQKASLPLR